MSNLVDKISRELITLEDENDPKASQVKIIWPRTTIDQVFDPESPIKEDLRDIIADLRQEIKTGGLGNIIFPVTSVNGMKSDVIITPVKLGLGRVDNTRDLDKPLSTPQRSAIMDILAGYNFKINLDPLYNHLKDMNNPHSVTIDQINKDDVLTEFVKRLITEHSLSTDRIVHMDIRNSMNKLWNYVDTSLGGGLDKRIDDVMTTFTSHLNDPSAHNNVLKTKEDILNKVVGFTDVNADNHNYPTTKAVSEYVNDRIISFNKTLPDLTNFIVDIKPIKDRTELPDPNAASYRKAYIIRTGAGSENEIAICRHDTDGTYSWDISTLGSISKFNNYHFIDTPNGLSLNMSNIIDSIINKTGNIDSTISNTFKGYYTRIEADSIFIKDIKILPGTMDGHIRYFINNDITTMSDDIAVPGLKNLAYLESVSEKEIKDLAVQNRHLMSGCVDSRVIKDKCITRKHISEDAVGIDMFTTPKGSVLGNLSSDDGIVQPVTLSQLANSLRPIINGSSNTNVPDVDLPIKEVSPNTWAPNTIIPFADGTMGMRFQGTISVISNTPVTTILTTDLNSVKYQILEAGGTWRADTDAEVDALVGGSNVFGNMFAEVLMTRERLEIASISIGNRLNAPYDIWIRYASRSK